jgi:hypothetical protein
LDDLQTLIKELESEKAELLRLIDEAVKEQEFLSAHFHFEALGQVNRQLQTLKNLDDELYDKKHFLEIRIENAKKRLKDETDDFLRSISNRSIEDNQQKLHELNQTPKRQRDINKKSLLPEYLEQFTKRKVAGLRIILSKKDSLLIELKNSKDGIKLTMPNVKKLTSKHLLTNKRLSKLRGLGFELDNRGDKATVILKWGKDDIENKIIRMISIIVFDVFYFKELGDEAAIEILNKRTRDNLK